MRLGRNLFFYRPTFTVYDLGPPAPSPTCEYRRAISIQEVEKQRGGSHFAQERGWGEPKIIRQPKSSGTLYTILPLRYGGTVCTVQSLNMNQQCFLKRLLFFINIGEHFFDDET
jgi:hypothetical protein